MLQAWKQLIENKEESQPATEDSTNTTEDKVNSETNSVTQGTPAKENGEILTMDDSNSMPMNIDDIPMPTNIEEMKPNMDEVDNSNSNNKTDDIANIQINIENTEPVNDSTTVPDEPVVENSIVNNVVKNTTPKSLTPVTNTLVQTPPTPGKVIANLQPAVNKVIQFVKFYLW